MGKTCAIADPGNGRKKIGLILVMSTAVKYSGFFFRATASGMLLLVLSVRVMADAADVAAAGAPRESVPDTLLPFAAARPAEQLSAASINFELAGFSARAKQYPLVMKFFLRSLLKRTTRRSGGETENPAAGFWRVSRGEDSLLGRSPVYEPESKRMAMSELLNVFEDTANAEQYALILQVKQPVYNKRKVIRGLGNVGHAFITLIRYNRDNSYTCHSFGFYPKKNYPLAASPVFPSVPGMFRDDGNHDWDEMIGRFISKARFRRILRRMASLTGRRYHLNHNNCTDFALDIAALGGIEIQDTFSRWPLGRGNNPAWTGQAIVAGEFRSQGSDSGDDLFVSLNHP